MKKRQHHPATLAKQRRRRPVVALRTAQGTAYFVNGQTLPYLLAPQGTPPRVVRWFKEPGEAVSRGEPLLLVEVAGQLMHVASASSGILSRVLVAAGRVIPVGQPVAAITRTAAVAEPDPLTWPPPPRVPSSMAAPPEV